MLKVIKDFCENGAKNGLIKLDMPTGSGKTYNVLNYIYEAAMDKTNNIKRFFFVTTLKKNLPIDDLRQLFADNGQAELFDEMALFIDSNSDGVLKEFYTIEPLIPQFIKDTKEYQNLLKYIERIHSIQEPLVLGELLQKFRKEIEPKFRRLISRKLHDKIVFPTVSSRLKAIKEDDNWRWVGILYPSVFIREKRIVFLSMDKFLVDIDPIIEPSYILYSSNLLKDSIVFIDEFDATKETALGSIIDSCCHEKVDYVELFQMIHRVFSDSKFSRKMTTAAENGKYQTADLESELLNLKNLFHDVFKAFSLEYNYKTDGAVPQTKNFLFHDHTYHTILDNKMQFVKIETDNYHRIHNICFVNERPNPDESIYAVLNAVADAISHFIIVVRKFADNYTQRKKETCAPGEDEFTLEKAIRTILAEFSLGKEYEDFLTSQILAKPQTTQEQLQDFDLSFYNNGFQYHCIEDSDTYDMKSKIVARSCNITPEKILLTICQKAKVVGISATASIPSVLGNYDIDYLKSMLKTAHFEPTPADKARMLGDFEASQIGYKNIKINVELFDCDGKSYSAESWNKVFDNKETAEFIYNELERKLGANKDNYYKARYVRIACAYKQFMKHYDDIQSFLCVLTALPNDYDDKLNISILNDIFSFLIEEQDLIPQAPLFSILSGTEFDKSKKELQKRFSNNERIFVMTTYQTVGAGQNLQYQIPPNLKDKLVTINNFPSRGEKDWDAIYLDRPTYLLSNVQQLNTEEDLIKYLYQITYLQEVGELAPDEANKLIENAFRSFGGLSGITANNIDVYGSKSLSLFHTSMIMQAIGRICRTNQKRENIYIYADKTVVEKLDPSVKNDRPLNYEFAKLLEYASEINAQPIDKTLENKAALKSSKALRLIKSMLRDKNKSDWHGSRIALLKYPTASYEEVANNKFIKSYHIEQPFPNNCIYYREDGDYERTEVSFQSASRFDKTVSSAAAQLDDFMSCHLLKARFEAEGYATHFANNPFIMSPTAFNNIYKGALGEVSGKFLFELLFKEDVCEIEEIELFELFDYRMPQHPIYIDFKDWHESFTIDNKAYLDEIYKKATTCNEVRGDCKCVIVANIFAEENWETHRIPYKDLTIVTIPKLLTRDVRNRKLTPSSIAYNFLLEVFDEFKY